MYSSNMQKKRGEDIFIKIEICNRAKNTAPIVVMPTLWFYNRWQYGGLKTKPSIDRINNEAVHIHHEKIGDYFLYFPPSDELLFTENETNYEKLFGIQNTSQFVKDAFMSHHRKQEKVMHSGKNHRELSLRLFIV